MTYSMDYRRAGTQLVASCVPVPFPLYKEDPSGAYFTTIQKASQRLLKLQHVRSPLEKIVRRVRGASKATGETPVVRTLPPLGILAFNNVQQ